MVNIRIGEHILIAQRNVEVVLKQEQEAVPILLLLMEEKLVLAQAFRLIHVIFIPAQVYITYSILIFLLFPMFKCNFIKKRLWGWCFLVNFAKFLRAPFLIEHLRSLRLNVFYCSVTFLSIDWFHSA